MITLILFVIFAACVAILWTEGMWGNAINLINIITAALLATNYFEPLADWIQGLNTNMATFTYVWDFLTVWGLFVIFMVVFRLATDKLSRVRVKFLKQVNQIGSCFFAAWVGWIMVCFTAMTLHVAPMGRVYLFGSFVPEQRVDKWPVSPEICWLGFVQRESRGAFCRSASEKFIGANPDWQGRAGEEPEKTRTFDPGGKFLPAYTTRRANVQRYNEDPNRGNGNIRVRSEWMNE